MANSPSNFPQLKGLLSYLATVRGGSIEHHRAVEWPTPDQRLQNGPRGRGVRGRRRTTREPRRQTSRRTEPLGIKESLERGHQRDFPREHTQLVSKRTISRHSGECGRLRTWLVSSCQRYSSAEQKAASLQTKKTARV